MFSEVTRSVYVSVTNLNCSIFLIPVSSSTFSKALEKTENRRKKTFLITNRKLSRVSDVDGITKAHIPGSAVVVSSCITYFQVYYYFYRKLTIVLWTKKQLPQLSIHILKPNVILSLGSHIFIFLYQNTIISSGASSLVFKGISNRNQVFSI